MVKFIHWDAVCIEKWENSGLWFLEFSFLSDNKQPQEMPKLCVQLIRMKDTIDMLG